MENKDIAVKILSKIKMNSENPLKLISNSECVAIASELIDLFADLDWLSNLKADEIRNVRNEIVNY